MKNYYGLLEIAATASRDDVKRAFRLQIARYHPDKVQHLGKEFQDMAAGRAAELTEAYRILSDPALRAEYDRSASTPPSARPPVPASVEPPLDQPGPAAEAPPLVPPSRPRFTAERASCDHLVRKAAIDRFKQALAIVSSGYDESDAQGFDVACVPKARLFGRGKGPRLFGRFVARVDGEAVADACVRAGKSSVPSNEEICVFLMGSGMAPLGELAEAIARQRRLPTRGGKVMVVPIDTRDWGAHVPTDAPAVVKNLLARLRGGP